MQDQPHEEEKVNNTSTSRQRVKKEPRRFGGKGRIKKQNDSKNKNQEVNPGGNNELFEATLLNEEQINAENQNNLPEGVNAVGQLVGQHPEGQIDTQNVFVDPVSPQKEELIAKIITDYLGEFDLEFNNIDKGILDPILKCIQGDYTGRFIQFDNCTSKITETTGIIIGGKPEYDLKKNEKKINLFIQDPTIDEIHARFFCRKYQKQTLFLVKDLSNHNNFSSGVHVQLPEREVDLLSHDYLDREFSILNRKYKFIISKIPNYSINEFQVWLVKNKLLFANEIFQNLKIKTIDQFKLFRSKELDDTQLEEEQKKRIIDAIEREIDERNNNYLQRQKNKVVQKCNLPQLKIEIFKEIEPQINQRSKYAPVDEVVFNGLKDFVFCSQDIYEEAEYEKRVKQGENIDVHTINDKSIPPNKQVEFRIVVKRESIFLVHKPFDYEQSNGVFINLWEQEEFPLHPGSVIQLGLKQQFLMERFNTGLIAAPGKRSNMEDRFIAVQDMKLNIHLPISIFSVLDGHGGVQCAIFLRENLEPEIRKNLLDAEFGIYGTKRGHFNECIANALTKSFNDLDERFYDKFGENYVAKKCGSTAVLILIVGSHIFCANVGDSRAVLSSNGKAIDLSLDHKASRKDEVARILEHDGVIEFGRVGAKLAITRAFGDFEFKLVIDENGQEFRKHFITSEPEIRRYDFNPFTDEFIILASDGLFDKFTSQEAVDFIREKMMAQDYQNQDVDKIAKQIAYESIYKKNVRDNTSVLIIALNRGVIEQPKE